MIVKPTRYLMVTDIAIVTHKVLFAEKTVGEKKEMLSNGLEYKNWLVGLLRFNTTLTTKIISWRSPAHHLRKPRWRSLHGVIATLAREDGDAHVFPGFFTPVLTQLLFPRPPTTFLTCFCRGERRKCTEKKVHLNRGSKSQPPNHRSDTFTTELLGRS